MHQLEIKSQSSFAIRSDGVIISGGDIGDLRHINQKVENIRFDTHIVLKNPYTLAEYCQKYFVLRPALRWKV